MKPVEPTPAEIRKACRKIQRGWTERERRLRSGKREKFWEAPAVRSERKIEE